MKISVFTFSVALGVASIHVSAAGAFGAPLEKGSAKGHAQLLMNASPAPQVTRAAMSCAKCENQFTKRVDWTARGANKPTVLVPKHLCDGCSTTSQVVGHGKQKQEVVSHTCTACGSEDLTCCTKGAKTRGMEKRKS